jgi:predicted  nucleic acid-binding Zn-ribbon protein
MNRLVVVSGVIALVVGIAGFLGSGWRTAKLQTELQDARANAVRFEQQVGELSAEKDQIAAQLKAERTHAESTETDLRREKEMNARLHLIVSEGRK